MKALVLLEPGDVISELTAATAGIEYRYACRRHTIFARLTNHFDWLTFPESSFILHADLKSGISAYDSIVLCETDFPMQTIRTLRRHNVHCKIIYWLRNPISDSKEVRGDKASSKWKRFLAMRKTYRFVVTSFDKQDCEKYGIAYSHQVAPFLKSTDLPSCSKNGGVSFIGKNKGRIGYLQKTWAAFHKMGIACHFYVVQGKHENLKRTEAIQFTSSQPYQKVVSHEIAADAVLDIVQRGQHGLTLRAVEALLYRKKLITNFQEIRDYDFYNSDNIFILGHDDMARLPSFMHTAYQHISSEIVRRYTFTEWLKRW